MKNLKNKRGISLIVLVITIIVMIILATVIVLSLNNSGIIGNANKAKNDSDTATLKEYVNTLKLDWEFMTVEEKTAAGSFSEYATSKLEEKGYKRIVTEDGIVLNEGATAAVKAGIEIGDTVNGYILDNSNDKKTYDTKNGNENTAPNYTEVGPTAQTVTRIEYTTWRYIGIGENGEVLIAPDMLITTATTAQKIKLSGKGGFVNGSKVLNDMCKAMYSTDKGKARSMNIDDITRILGYTGNKGTYYDASGNEVKTPAPKKISEIGTLRNPSKPDESDIGDYYSNYYYIRTTSTDILKSVSTDLKTKLTNFVYTSDTYWLASSCVYAHLKDNEANFCVRCVISNRVDSFALFSSKGGSYVHAYVARPVVALNPDVQLIEETDGNWKIN